MARTRTLPIRMSDSEMERLGAMAQMEKLPLSTFIRRRLLFEADQRGIFLRTISANDKPATAFQGASGFVEQL